MINLPVSHDESYPPAASATGKNAYYLKGCEAVERSPSYAACLFKIGEVENGRENVMYSECSTALRQGKCMAREMRDEEALKGVALYFFPRAAPQALHVPFKAAGDFGVRITNLTDPAVIPRDPKPTNSRFTEVKKAKVIDPLDAELDAMSGGYAAAINAAVTDLAPEPAPIVPVKPVIATPKPAPPKPAPVAVANPGRPAMQPNETPLQYARRIAASRIAVPA